MYEIRETLVDDEKVVARYDDSEYDLMIEHWDDWLTIADNAHSLVKIVHDGATVSSYDQRKRVH